MSDPTYRTPVSQESQPEAKSQTSGATISNSEVEPPFTSYEIDKGKPFLVDHYELGPLWDHTDMYSDTYKGEVKSINTYLTHLIETGELNNTLSAVKSKLQSIEKMINIPKDSRTAVKLGQIAAYAEFLIKADGIKKDAAKYGMI